jgi:hypothetical protein
MAIRERKKSIPLLKVPTDIEGLSLAMFVLYFLVQVAFSIEGFFRKNKMLMVCMGLSAVVSGTIILLAAYLRDFGG